MNPTDEATLVEMLVGLLAQVPSRSVRMVAFNMDVESEPYRSDSSQPIDVAAVSQALASVRFGTISESRARHIHAAAVRRPCSQKNITWDS